MRKTNRFRERQSTEEDNFPAGTLLGTIKRYNASGQLISNLNCTSGVGNPTTTFQKTWDEKHVSPFLDGGPFFSTKVVLPGGMLRDFRSSTKGSSVLGLPAGDYLVYDGRIGNPTFTGDPTTQLQYNTAGFSSPYYTGFATSVDGYNALAWSRTKPKLEHGGLGQAIAELRDLPKMLKQSSRGFHEVWKSLGGSQTSPMMQPKKVAQHYLNHQFGWVPFVSDIGNLSDVQYNSQKYIDQITADNNQWVRRRRVLEKTDSSILLTRNTMTCGFEPTAISQLCAMELVDGRWTGVWHEVYKILTDLVWAVGRFKFYRPEFDKALSGYDSAFNRTKQLLILHGARVNPSLLYKVTPWTWLIDWFTGVGNVVDTMSAIGEDQIVAKYLYVMKHSVYKIRQISYCLFYSGATKFVWDRFVDSKQRASADSPYGFILPNQLSARQITILTALGLDRAI